MPSRRRIDVWQAMSELFLDTEVRPSIPYIAASCVRSGYNDPMLEHIFRYEVSPVLWWNMLAATGEWQLFSEEWLLERLREVPFPATVLQRVRGHFRYVPKADWWLTLELVGYLRGLPNDERDERCSTMHFLIDAYFERGPFLKTLTPPREDAATQKQIFDKVLRERLSRLIVKGVEKWTHQEGCHYVEDAIARAGS